MDVLDPASSVLADEHGVMLVGALIEQMGVGECRHHLRVDASGLAQVSENPPHISVGGGWDQFNLLFLLPGREDFSCRPDVLWHIVQLGNGTAQVLGHGPFLRHPLEVLQELHGIPVPAPL